jgi:LmbE family N-acetylglucosaminyl deacetylase
LDKKVIVFAPHPDDETWGCGGTMARRISEGFEVSIVVLTDGRYAFSKAFGIESNPTPEELKKIRHDEVVRATSILGVPKDDLVFLDFEDGRLEDHMEEAQADVNEILDKNHVAEVYFPYENDFHPDHRVTSHIVREAIDGSNNSLSAYQYSILHKYGRIGPIIDSLLKVLKQKIVTVDVKKFLPLKKAAMKEFKSEFEIISEGQEKPLADARLVQKFLKSEEKFYISRARK